MVSPIDVACALVLFKRRHRLSISCINHLLKLLPHIPTEAIPVSWAALKLLLLKNTPPPSTTDRHVHLSSVLRKFVKWLYVCKVRSFNWTFLVTDAVSQLQHQRSATSNNHYKPSLHEAWRGIWRAAFAWHTRRLCPSPHPSNMHRGICHPYDEYRWYSTQSGLKQINLAYSSGDKWITYRATVLSRKRHFSRGLAGTIKANTKTHESVLDASYNRAHALGRWGGLLLTIVFFHFT